MAKDAFDFLDPVSESRSPLRKGLPVILYGAGHFGRELARVLRKRGTPVACFLDRRVSTPQELDGIRLFNPGDAAVERSKYPVIVSIFNRDVDIPGVVDDLKNRGFGSVATLMDVYEDLAAELKDRFWLTSKTFYGRFKDPIREAYGLFADELSRDLFRKILEFRISGNHRVLPAVHADQYFPNDIPPRQPRLRFVDAGAYDGDTLRDIVARGLKVEALAAFEPDAGNFQKLSGFVRGQREHFGDEVSLYPCGLWSKTARLPFDTGQDEASHVASSESGTNGAPSFIQCVALDDVLPRFAPTLIKMDIEGAETDALEGAVGTITEHLPELAICVYHRPADLWSIPLRVRALSSRYSLFMRCHAYSGFDCVLYAVPG